MWNNFLYGIWLAVPTFFFAQFSYNKVIEIRKKNEDPINRSGYFLQVAIFTSICTICCIVINEFFLIDTIPSLISADYALEAVQVVFYPLFVSLLAPFAGSNKAPETLQDHIQKHGILKEFKNKKDENRRR